MLVNIFFTTYNISNVHMIIIKNHKNNYIAHHRELRTREYGSLAVNRTAIFARAKFAVLCYWGYFRNVIMRKYMKIYENI